MVRLILLLMKILFLTILICTSFLFPSSSFASHIELKPCVEIAHCVREEWEVNNICLLYTSPSPRDQEASRMPSSA